MKIVFLIGVMLTVLVILHAVTLNVALDGSQDYTSIQTAIEAANNGDTVLVYPGRYYENIDYIGKSITVCSLEASTNDSSYISITIIDGNQNGSCVAFRNAEQNASLRGFTITNGIGYPIWDGLRRGGGILIYTNSTVVLTNCTISKNNAAIGGGIFSFSNNMALSGLRIYDNYAIVQGGGIALNGASTHYPTIVFDPVNRCSIYSNYGANPVDILVTDIRANLEINLDMFTVGTPDRFYVARHSNIPVFEQYNDTVNIQRAYRTEVNHDLYVSPSGNDSNSGLSPSQAMKSITKAVHRIAADSLNVKTVHVLPGTYSEGSNDQILPIPLKSNINIIGAGSDFTTISSNIAPFTSLTQFLGGDRCTNILVKGFRIISGISEGNRALGMGNLTKNTIISDIVSEDMVPQKWGAVCLDYIESSTFDSLIVRNITTPESAFEIIAAYSGSITNSIFENIHSTYTSPDTPGDDSWGTTVVNIWVEDSLKVENCTFRNISVQNNQNTFHISNTYNGIENVVDVNVNNCLFENIRTNAGASVVFGNNRYGNFDVTNCTFYDNYGQGAAVGIGGKVEMRNNVFYNPEASNELFLYNASPQTNFIGNLDFDYNCIPGGEARISNTDPRNTVIYGVHNLETDPQFASTSFGNPEYLHLGTGSPCINTGTPDTLGLDLPPYDLAGNWRIWNDRIDMGCFEYDSVPWVANDDPYAPSLPGQITAINYPNPFNPETTISFAIPGNELSFGKPGSGKTTINIYNLKGQLVRQLVDSYLAPGSHKANWDGRNDGGSIVASGIYFYRITSGQYAFSGKMILAK